MNHSFSQLIRQNVAKDRYMLELEKRMKDHDVRRQATYLNVNALYWREM